MNRTFQLLQNGDTTGVFQLESAGMRQRIKQIKPTKFEDIVAVNALYRPGPMESIPLYQSENKDKKNLRYEHPVFRTNFKRNVRHNRLSRTNHANCISNGGIYIWRSRLLTKSSK